MKLSALVLLACLCSCGSAYNPYSRNLRCRPTELGHLTIAQMDDPADFKMEFNTVVKGGKLLAVKRSEEESHDASKQKGAQFRLLECHGSSHHGSHTSGLVQTEKGNMCLTLRDGTMTLETCTTSTKHPYSAQIMSFHFENSYSGEHGSRGVVYLDKNERHAQGKPVVHQDMSISWENGSQLSNYALALVSSPSKPISQAKSDGQRTAGMHLGLALGPALVCVSLAMVPTIAGVP